MKTHLNFGCGRILVDIAQLGDKGLSDTQLILECRVDVANISNGWYMQ